MLEDSKHCAFCNRCVHEFDHHCKWVSNDIGRFNYINFLRMLIFTTLMLILEIVTAIVGITRPNKVSDGGDIQEESTMLLSKEGTTALCVVTITLSFLVLMPIVFLFCFHLYLIRRNMTTLAYLRMKRNNSKSSSIVTKV